MRALGEVALLTTVIFAGLVVALTVLVGPLDLAQLLWLGLSSLAFGLLIWVPAYLNPL